MNKYLKQFLHRGLVFGGFGPIILGIVYAILQYTVPDFSLNGVQILVAIVSIYLVAFLQAGASVFNQIEHWSIAKSTFFHFLVLYIAYIACYLINSWITFNLNALLIFTAVFVAIYIVVWLTVVITIKAVSKKLNKNIG